MKTTLSRRSLLSTGAALGITLLLRRTRIVQADPPAMPRFLLTIVASGGLDTIQMFDARPLAMTAAGKVHNPLGQDPTPWVGNNGQQTLAASTASPLAAVRDKFSVINGVVMSTTFDGHDQNTNLLLTGNPFGGTSFNIDLNIDDGTPLDYIRLGEIPVATLEDSRTMPLSEAGLKQLVTGVGSLDNLSPSLDGFLSSESGSLGTDKSRFGAGVKQLDAANLASKQLRQQFKGIKLGTDTDPLDQQLAVIREVFRLGIARGAMFAIDGDDLFFDNHAPQAAQGQGPSFTELTTRIARVFQFLASTAYDDTHSLLDVTTVVMGSEFGRTMRQLDKPIDATGTDHNPLSATCLLGGAGVVGGLVLGASDFQTATETLSGAHMALDPENVKAMGRPFDFTSCTVRSDKPAAFAASDYLQVGSVINTVYSLFGVDKSKWRLVERAGDACPVLNALVA